MMCMCTVTHVTLRPRHVTRASSRGSDTVIVARLTAESNHLVALEVPWAAFSSLSDWGHFFVQLHLCIVLCLTRLLPNFTRATSC